MADVAWPTGKPHISFSELSNWIECSWRHKLLYIDKLGSFTVTPHVDFGTACHNTNENFIQTRVMKKDIAFDFINESWKTNAELFSKGPFPDWASNGYGTVDDWIEKADRVLEDVPAFLDKEFPGWECFSAEEQLYESIDGQPIRFKGFIDAVFVTTDAKGNKKYWLIDWKTCGWGWTRYKKQDFNIQLQLILYKNFWSKKHDIPMKDIRCAFALMKRDAKPGASMGLVPVSVGPVTSAKGLKIIENHSRSVQKGFFLKNRNSCRFCDFENTEHCPPNL